MDQNDTTIEESGMVVIAGHRQSGKTTEAIKLANERDAYLVVHTKDRATHLYHSDKHPDLDKFPISYEELRDRQVGKHRLRVVIDDLDMFLSWMVDVPVEGVAMTAAETVDLSTRD